MALLTLLAAVTIAIVRQRSLFGVVILAGIYSFLMASVLIVLDAVDVAMTEASVGAGISTVLLLATLHLTKTVEMLPFRRNLHPAAACRWWSAALRGLGDAGAAAVRQRPTRRSTRTSRRTISPTSVKDTGVPNVVTAVLADYRGLRHARRDDGDLHRRHRRAAAAARAAPPRPRGRSGGRAMRLDLILRVVTKLILPFILLFALYVQFHGDYGPGGGFQAGVIAAGMVILYAIIFGLNAAKRIAPPRTGRSAWFRSAFSIYAGTGVVGLLLGKNFLDYSVLAHDAAHGPRAGNFSCRSRRAGHRCGTDDRHVLRLRRAGTLMDVALRLRKPLQLCRHHLPDGRRPLHRHRPRQHDQEAGRPVAVPDFGLSALHRAGKDPRRHAADHRSGASPSIPIRCRTS